MTSGRKPLLEERELLSGKVMEVDGIVGSRHKKKINKRNISSKVK